MSGAVSDVTSDNDWQFLCEQNVPTGTTAETPFRIQGTIPHPFVGYRTPSSLSVKDPALAGEQLLDEAEVTFGIRDAVLKDGFYLNGKTADPGSEPPSELSLCRLCHAGEHAEAGCGSVKKSWG